MSETMQEVQKAEPKESLFSKKNRKLITDPFDNANPITVQVLGICSALAVTAKVEPALVMSICVVFVTGMANLLTSLLRKGIPPRIRMIVQLIIIASLVTIVNIFLEAFAYAMYKELAIFIGLIITNCIVMGRLEAFAMANTPGKSLLDGIGNGLGYGAILILVAIFREFFGSGTLFNIQLIPQFVYDMGYVNNGLMLLPPMAMIVIGVIIWAQRARNKELIDIS